MFPEGSGRSREFNVTSEGVAHRTSTDRTLCLQGRPHERHALRKEPGQHSSSAATKGERPVPRSEVIPQADSAADLTVRVGYDAEPRCEVQKYFESLDEEVDAELAANADHDVVIVVAVTFANAD